MSVQEPASLDVCDLANSIYEERLYKQVETPENIGKMLIQDVDSGDYEIDVQGLEANRRLRARHPGLDPHRLFGIRIGYEAAYTFGGGMRRRSR